MTIVYTVTKRPVEYKIDFQQYIDSLVSFTQKRIESEISTFPGIFN